MDKDYKEKFGREEHVLVPQKVCVTRVNLNEVGFTARCPGCTSLLRGTARQAPRNVEREWKGDRRAKAEAAKDDGRSTWTEQSRHAKRKRSTTLEGEGQQKTQRATTGQTHEGMQPQRSGGSSSSSGAMGANKSEDFEERDTTDKRRKADEVHPEDPERSDGKWMRSEGPKKKAEDEEEESRLRKTVKYFKKLDKAEANAGIAEVEVKEEDSDEEDAGDMQQGRRDELWYRPRHCLQEAMSRGGTPPTTTKSVDRANKGADGKEFVKCLLVARDVKSKQEGPRDRLFAAMPPLEAKKALFAFEAGAREKRRDRGHTTLPDEKRRKRSG